MTLKLMARSIVLLLSSVVGVSLLFIYFTERKAS